MKLKKRRSGLEFRCSGEQPAAGSRPVRMIGTIADLQADVRIKGGTLSVRSLSGFEALKAKSAPMGRTASLQAPSCKARFAVKHRTPTGPIVLGFPSVDDALFGDGMGESPASSTDSQPNPFDDIAMMMAALEFLADQSPPTPPKDLSWMRPLTLAEKQRHERAERTLTRARSYAALHNDLSCRGR